MFSRGIRVGTLAGIPIGVQPLWFLILILITWSLGAFYYPETVENISDPLAYALGLLSALLLFASIILHELGHSIVARRVGVEVEQIDLWILGGVARMKGYPKRSRDELQFALAGPAVTLVIAGLFALVALALPSGTPQELSAVVEYQVFINVAILVFNMLPAFPLDGGRVARALLWGWIGNLQRATHIAATIGKGFGFAMIGLGLMLALFGAVGGIWIALVGFFVTMAAKAEEGGLRIRTAFEGREAGRFMSYPAITMPGDITVDEAVRDYFVRHRFTAFPVVDRNGAAIGLIDIPGVEAVPHERRQATAVRHVARSDRDLFIDEHRDVADLLGNQTFQEAGRAVVATDRGGYGLISVTDANRALRAMDLLAKSP